MAVSFVDILKILGLPFFSGVFRVMRRFSKSMSIHLRFFASPIRIPVSLRSWRSVAFFLAQPAIKSPSSFSVGMKGIFSLGRYLGGLKYACEV